MDEKRPVLSAANSMLLSCKSAADAAAADDDDAEFNFILLLSHQTNSVIEKKFINC